MMNCAGVLDCLLVLSLYRTEPRVSQHPKVLQRPYFAGMDAYREKHSIAKKFSHLNFNYLLRVCVCVRLRDEHILFSLDGPDENVLKFKSPMCFAMSDVDLIYTALDKILSDLEA